MKASLLVCRQVTYTGKWSPWIQEYPVSGPCQCFYPSHDPLPLSFQALSFLLSTSTSHLTWFPSQVTHTQARGQENKGIPWLWPCRLSWLSVFTVFLFFLPKILGRWEFPLLSLSRPPLLLLLLNSLGIYSLQFTTEPVESFLPAASRSRFTQSQLTTSVSHNQGPDHTGKQHKNRDGYARVFLQGIVSQSPSSDHPRPFDQYLPGPRQRWEIP